MLAAQELPDGWNTPYYLADPSTGKWALLNPCYIIPNDTDGVLRTTYVGPLTGNISISSIEAGFPVGKTALGIFTAGIGEFGASFYNGRYTERISIGNQSINRALFGLYVSRRLIRNLSAGSSILIASRQNSVNQNEKAPGFSAGVLADFFQNRFEAGLSGGGISNGGGEPMDYFLSVQTSLRLWDERIVVANSVRIPNEQGVQVQSIVKYWLFESAALRTGWDPAGWNIGMHWLFRAGNRTGFLEYYLGRNIYHHVHFTLEL